MPQRTPSCQLANLPQGDSRQKSPSQGAPSAAFELVRGTLQELENTPSRRTGPRRWLRAVHWLIAAGIHPKANQTTLRVAEDLAARMDYDTGHARYCLEETAARLGIDRSTVKRHVAVLRGLGALAWHTHGTKRNVLRLRGKAGYAGTATIYAAVIPAVYDDAMGYQRIGTGYETRIIVDYRKPSTAPGKPAPKPSKPVDNSPVDNPASGSCAPPSLTSATEEGKLKVEGTSKDTSRKRASRNNESTQGSSKKGTTGRTATQVAADIRITRLVRAMVNWTQTEGLRRLAYSLRPLIDRGLDGTQIAGELYGMCIGWRPSSPANFIRTQLAKDTADIAGPTLWDGTPLPDQYQPTGPLTASNSSLIGDVLVGVHQGLAAYSANQAARGLDDLTPSDAAADMAAFLGQTGAAA